MGLKAAYIFLMLYATLLAKCVLALSFFSTYIVKTSVYLWALSVWLYWQLVCMAHSIDLVLIPTFPKPVSARVSTWNVYSGTMHGEVQ